ncbi:MAG: ferredoxin-type protein NapF [Gammaproteobacteria bacterium]|nr:ferredoxin-type protein NapF [Gammaproteobacteria bacterium]
MSRSINRMQFLRGDLSGVKAPVRPPWALHEAQFVERCTACGDCVTACFDQLIVAGRANFPQMDFKQGGCDFCGDCLAICKAGALSGDPQDAETRPWSLKASILNNCLSLNAVVCRSCGEACDARAIHFKLEIGGVAKPLLDSELCTGCGECFSVCPVDAVQIFSVERSEQAA